MLIEIANNATTSNSSVNARPTSIRHSRSSGHLDADHTDCRRGTQLGIVVSVEPEQPNPSLPTSETSWKAERSEPESVSRQLRSQIRLPIILFAATCLSTCVVGGLAFSLALMTTLLAHELGHFLQAKRYGVPATLPYFIPMPFSPIGTMGAVIVMAPGQGDRRSLFDIAVTGPLAGLVPALLFCVLGLHWSEVVQLTGQPIGLTLGEPILFKLLSYLTFGPLAQGQDVVLHPVAFAGWVGIFITALNLIPIGQLDGGHILYALLLRRAGRVAQVLLAAAMIAVVVWGYWGWTLMIFLLMLVGPVHPPTANDNMPLGTGRTVLGWASLLFVLVGFTPTPFGF
jgi:membrane-associated protease RseP (regulator of RpoE activity)